MNVGNVSFNVESNAPVAAPAPAAEEEGFWGKLKSGFGLFGKSNASAATPVAGGRRRKHKSRRHRHRRRATTRKMRKTRRRRA